MHDCADRDRRLAAEAGEGSEAAFAELVARHRGALVRAVAGRSGRALIAEDAVQEALLSAHRALRRGQRPTDVRAWLHTIAWRRTLDLVRRERDTATLAEAACRHADDGPEARVDRADELATTLREWLRLPDRQRHALALSVLEGRTLEEIADAMDLTPQGAKALVARGRRTLSAKLEATREPCDEVVPRILAAVEQGAKLPAAVRWHADACAACARTHRQARRRRRMRSILLVPAALVERLRDLAVVSTSHEPQVSLVAKLCASACAVTVAGGGSVAVVAERLPDREPALAYVAAKERHERERERDRRPARHEPAAVAVAVAASTNTAAAATPAPGPEPVATPASAPTRAASPRPARPKAVARVVRREQATTARPSPWPRARTTPKSRPPTAPAMSRPTVAAAEEAPPGPATTTTWERDPATGLVVARPAKAGASK